MVIDCGDYGHIPMYSSASNGFEYVLFVEFIIKIY